LVLDRRLKINIDFDGQSLAFFQSRIPIFPRNNHTIYSKLNAFYTK